MRHFLVLTFFLFNFTIYSNAQVFTDITPGVLEDFSSGEAKWVDYDADGDLDLYFSGSSQFYFEHTAIYTNSAGSFTENVTTGLTPLRKGYSAWGDLNNDGYIDLVRAGMQGDDFSGEGHSYIAINNTDGTFTENYLPDNKTFYSGDVALADFDADGDLDILITGRNNQNVTESRFYRNEGDGNFSALSTISLKGMDSGNIEVGDYDLDGDIDILISGRELVNNGSLDYFTIVYTNNGNWNFSEENVDIGGEPFGVKSVWGDIDSDGYLDIITQGRIGNDVYGLSVSRGSATGFSTVSGTGLPELEFVDRQKFIDFNNDGYLDLIIAGYYENSENDVSLYQNNGDLTFTETTSGFEQYQRANFDIGDYDMDGDLDIIMIGQNSSFVDNTSLYINNASTANTLPSIPSGVAASVDGTNVLLSWSLSNDSETATTAISYNLRIGITTNGIEVKSPSSNISTGQRYISQVGNIGTNNYTTLENLANGTYYFAVQAIDNSMGASDFSLEGSFTITAASDSPEAPSQLNAEFLNTDKVVLTWLDQASNETSFQVERAVDGGSFENYTTLPPNTMQFIDTEVTNETLYTYRIQAFNGAEPSAFSNEININTPPQGFFSNIDTLTFVNERFNSSSSSLVDYNADGLLDIFIINSFEKCSLYKNLGENNFISVANDLSEFTGQTRSITWSDINNDGYPEAFITTSSENALFLNNGDDTFTRIGQSEFTATNDSNGAAWGDVNNDGYSDIYIANSSGEGELYLNNQDNTFTQVLTGDPITDGISAIDATFIDINNDSWIDLFVAGYFDNNSVYINDKSGNLIKQTDNTLSDLNYPSVGSSWADFDNDGDFDVLVTNNVNERDEFYENDGDGNFTSVSNAITNAIVQGSSSAWLDFDNDGWEDVIIVTGNSKVLFRNTGDKEFELIDEYALSSTQYSESVSTGDLDQDGFVDIIVANGGSNIENEFFYNNGNSNNWLKVRLTGTINNSDGIGANIKVKTTELSMTKPVITNSGNNGQSGFVKHFGLASSSTADVEVFWPGNGIQIVSDVSSNQEIDVMEVQLPDAPLSLSAESISYNMVDLTWEDNSMNELGFVIYRSDDSIGTFQRIDTVAANVASFTDTNVDPKTQYHYIIRAYIAEGTSFNSNTLEVTTLDAPPIAPTAFALEVVSDTQISLNWTDNSTNEEGFIVEQSISTEDNWMVIDSTASNINTYQAEGLVEGQVYFYRVLAFNEGGNSEYSNVASASPVTGMRESITGNIRIFPNPASNLIMIEIPKKLSPSSYSVINMQGAVIQSGTLNQNKSNNFIKVDISHLKSGVYIFSLKGSNQELKTKMIIDK